MRRWSLLFGKYNFMSGVKRIRCLWLCRFVWFRVFVFYVLSVVVWLCVYGVVVLLVFVFCHWFVGLYAWMFDYGVRMYVRVCLCLCVCEFVDSIVCLCWSFCGLVCWRICGCVCVCVFSCLCFCVCVCVCRCVRLFVCICVYLCIFEYVCVCLCVFAAVYVFVWVFKCI